MRPKGRCGWSGGRRWCWPEGGRRPWGGLGSSGEEGHWSHCVFLAAALGVGSAHQGDQGEVRPGSGLQQGGCEKSLKPGVEKVQPAEAARREGGSTQRLQASRAPPRGWLRPRGGALRGWSLRTP